ncbi:cyclic dof factor 1-like [Punica granatum]|uniref:Cyclic dof factor 1-like n=1 Tax=Punica granatum TaxID=22663 RepID=A0A218XZB9_PUNGR|nr:cyclic dof factor 1-like [Punica granatum]OWM90407.1 hypothetical protein CDL15_Pgr014710 [Punica granatum]
MVEAENPAIKLFGKSIKLPSSSPDRVFYPPPPAFDDSEGDEDEETEQDPSEERAILNKRKGDESAVSEEELISPVTSSDSVNPKTPSIDEETSKSKGSKTGKDPKDSSKPQEKVLKKPDKILPCPRCNSMETKFCYYNNYNVNQPRHFCKACQRYWTAGGTMRNVPVGAGRRKSKSSASRYRHISISEALQAAAQVDAANRTHHHYQNLTPNGTVLTFGLNHYDPVTSPVEKRAANGTRNVSRDFEGQGAAKVSCARVETRDDRSSGNFPIEHSVPNLPGFVPQVPCLNNVPWPYTIPIPFYPTGFWACSNVSIPSPWNFPLLSPPPNQNGLIPGPNSPTLGKRPRDGDVIKADSSAEQDPTKPKKNGSILIPKTLRIDDPTEAAKSSIWATLGIKNECGLFRGFQATGKDKGGGRACQTEAEKCRVLCANPAALSRSLNFHEST